MLVWLRSHGEVVRVGVEATGSYGAGITRHLALCGIPVLEVTGPDSAARRSYGKDDCQDAISAARAALSGQRVRVAKDRSGAVPAVATKIALKSLARRVLDLSDEIADLDRLIAPLVGELGPKLLALVGVGVENAGEFLVTAGDNPERLTSEAGFAMLCGAAPLPAASGKTNRHRLNRGGNRQANSALHMVVMCRMRRDERTKDYVARRLAEGLSKREIIRCLKRYVAREIYGVLVSP